MNQPTHPDSAGTPQVAPRTTTPVAPPPPPYPPSLADRYWPGPQTPPTWLWAGGALAAGLVAASLLVADHAGLNVLLTAVAVVASVALLGPLRRDPWHRALGGLALALAAVPVLWDSDWLVALCLLGAFGVGAFVVADGRSWLSVPLSVPSLGVAWIRGLVWMLPLLRRRAGWPRNLGSWIRGVLVGGVATLVVGALLASADEGFGNVVSHVVPEIHLGELPARVFVLVATVCLVIAAGFSLVAPVRWNAVTLTPRRGAVQEWGIPLMLVDLVVVAFFAVQLTMLFGGDEVVLRGTGVTYAERARQGFGQLVVVTLVILALLAWAGRRCDPENASHRRALAGLGGGLVVGALLLCASALRRLWLYEQAYGFTVLRVDVAAFEVWLAVVILLVAAAWWAPVARLLPRLVVTWAAVGLLGLGLVGPDAVVARANVDRFERTGKIDMEYLSQLSQDAVPALDRLPEPHRSCVLMRLAGGYGDPADTAGPRGDGEPWYTVNVSRVRASGILEDLSGTTWGSAGCPALWNTAEARSS